MRVTNPNGSRLVPALRYRNVAAAVDWLCGAFGFEKHDVVTAVDGTILHARLMFGSDMILLLPARGADTAGRAPEDAGNEMQSCYFVVDDADLHYRQAKAAGAEILDITEYDYGGRGYCCRDPEGHLWNFGTYDPRNGQALTTIEHWPTPPAQPSYWQTVASDLRIRTAAGFKSLGDKITPPVIVAAVVAAVIAAATVGWMVALPQSSDKRLTFRSSPATQPEAAQPRTQVNSLAIRSPAPQQQSDEFERAARQAAPAPTRVNSPAFAAIGVQPAEQDGATRETAERNAEEALRQLRAAQRTAGEAFRQLRETSAESAAAAPADTRRQMAKASPDPREQEALLQQQQLAREQQIARQQQMAREQQAAKEQQLARERAAKESAALIEEQFARERAQKDAVERAKLSAVTPPKETTRPAQEAKTDGQQFWDCQPSPSGEVVCNPKKGAAPSAPAPTANPAAPAPEAKAPVPPKPKATAAAAVAAEPAAVPAPQQPKASASSRLWDCQPQPPTGEVVCKPMGGPAKQ
jgi:uncharacterized glyoxalase superfamily protein PhnB